MLKFNINCSIEEFIECDESILTNEDLTDKEIYDLVVNNEEEVYETNDNENVEEVPSIIEITKNEAVRILDCLFNYFEQKELFTNEKLFWLH